MRRIYLLLSLIVIVLVAANIYYYLNIYRQQVDFQKNILARQTEICSWEIEHHISNFLSEINYILFTEDISRFFTDPETNISSKEKIEVFFGKYRQLITSIKLYDDNRNVFSIVKERNGSLITDTYISREQTDLYEKEFSREIAGTTRFIIPFFKGSYVLANIEVTIDTEKYIEEVIYGYHIEQTLWQWIADSEGNIIFSNLPLLTRYSGRLDGIFEELSTTGFTGSLIHRIDSGDGRLKVISSFYPIKLMHQDLIMVFSLDTSIVVEHVIISIIIVSAATFVVLIVIILFFLYFIRNEQTEKNRSKESEKAIRDIFESLPMGIIIKGADNKIKLINSTALKILKIGSSENVLGKDLSNMFFLFRNYPDNHKPEQLETTSEYVYYDTDENELILYKKEIRGMFLGENIRVEAFMDISPIEHARKSEYLFGEAKTDFLKRISHDIRNPLNGILNMAGVLESEMKPDSPATEKTTLIRQCCEDIISVVNDIMDFSTFEADKTLVEEVPFVLNEEITLAVKPLESKADDKKIGFIIDIHENVPKNLIGDPFHLRQILMNLISNSLKYTKEGEIKLSVKTKKQTAGNVLLDFILEDTGIGMPEDKIRRLNERENIRELMAAGSFGLHKTRQLVKLMKGDITLESPAFESDRKWGPGTRVRFYVQFYSNERTKKKLNVDHIKNYKDIKTIVLSEPGEKKSDIQKMVRGMGIQCEATEFNESTIYNLRSKLEEPAQRHSVIFIIDSENSSGFSIARQLHKHNLDEYFLIIMVSSVNKPGNFIKSKRFGADYYLIEPYEASEIFDIIQDNFHYVRMSVSKKTLLKKVKPGLKILVAEDNHTNQIVAESIFKSLGYNIDIASNGREALEKVREKDYDIVFMDIRMPEKNGLDATYEIRKLGYNMPIIAMTANAGETDKTEAIEVGMNDFIAKPVRIEVLKNIIIKRFSQ